MRIDSNFSFSVALPRRSKIERVEEVDCVGCGD